MGAAVVVVVLVVVAFGSSTHTNGLIFGEESE
jgi:hypothetical protein